MKLMEGRMRKNLGMLAVNMELWAANMRQTMGIVKTMNMTQITGMMKRARLVKLNKD
jgi:UV DNA damage repair endonuclease